MTFRPGQLVILAAGVVVLIFSFFNFLTVDDLGTDAAKEQCATVDRSDLPPDLQEQYDTICGAVDDGGFNAWSTDVFFPLATWPAILGTIAAALTAAAMFAGLKLPDVLGFSPRQLVAALTIPGALMMLGWLINGTEDGTGWGIGFWLMLVGSLALVVGAVMELLADGDAATAGPNRTGGTAPTPF